MVAEKTAKNFRGLLFSAAPCIYMIFVLLLMFSSLLCCHRSVITVPQVFLWYLARLIVTLDKWMLSLLKNVFFSSKTLLKTVTGVPYIVSVINVLEVVIPKYAILYCSLSVCRNWFHKEMFLAIVRW